MVVLVFPYRNVFDGNVDAILATRSVSTDLNVFKTQVEAETDMRMTGADAAGGGAMGIGG